jgi:hypothetical protein
MHIDRKVLVVKRTTLDNDEEGENIWPLLDEASDNSVAEIIPKILYLFYIPLVRQENRKNGSHHRWLYGLYRLYF